MLETLGVLVLGWLLGILAGPIMEANRKARRRKELLDAIKTELRDARHLMSSVVYLTRSNLGTLDHRLIAWLLPIERAEAVLTGNPKPVQALEEIEKLLPAGLAAQQVNRVRLGAASSVKTYRLPMLEASIPELVLLKPEDQRRLLAIRERLDLLNQEVPYCMDLLDKTFDESLGTLNRERVIQNLESGYKAMGDRAHDIADLITEVLSDLPREKN